VEQGGEIKNAHVFRNQVFILAGSLALTAGLLILLAVGMQSGMGQDGVLVASSGYWYGVPEALVGGTFLMPNLLAIALTSSPIIVALIGIGYIMNSFQIVCNCYIGTTRIMVAQGLDGLLPEWFSRVHPRWRTPANAHLAYFLGSVPIILLFNLVGDWSTKWALGVTLANGAVFVLSALAAALLPYRARSLYEASPGAKYKVGDIPVVTILGALGFLLGGFMLWAFLFVDDLGLAFSADNPTPYAMVLGTIVFGALVYWIMRAVKARRGIKVEYAFAEIPPE
jgi:amino acid transporter